MRLFVIVLGGKLSNEKVSNKQFQNQISFCCNSYNLLQPTLSMSGATPPFPYIRVMQKNNFYISYLLYRRYLNHIPIQHIKKKNPVYKFSFLVW